MIALTRDPQPRIRMSGFDRLLLRLSPRLAYNRLRYRMAAERAYEAAKTSRLRKEQKDARSPDQVAHLAIDKLRAQARWLDENHDLARSVLHTLVSEIVGPGILTFPMPKDRNGEVLTDLAEQIFTLLQDWGKRPEVTHEMDWGKAQQLACRAWMRDGEMLAQEVMGTVADLDHGSRVQYSLELMEADYLPTGLNDSRQLVRQGVEKDRWGRPRGYWMYKDHPAETSDRFLLGGSSPALLAISTGYDEVRRIDADRMIHLKHCDRIRQTRGISVFASVFTRLDDLKDYEESERIAARLGAAFALAITKPFDAPSGTPSSTDAFREMDISPGIIADGLLPGEKVETIKNERPDNKLTDFRASQLRATAGGTNTSYSNISKDFAGSYSSQRQELVVQGRIYQMLRGEFAAVFNQRAYTSMVKMAVLQGLIDTRRADPLTLYDAQHVGLGTAYIEPKREAEADVLCIKSGIKSLTTTQLARGLNPREMHRQLVDEQNKQNAAGLVLSGNLGAQAKLQAEAAPDSDEDDSADDDSANRYVVGRHYEDDDGNVYEYCGAGGFEKVAASG